MYDARSPHINSAEGLCRRALIPPRAPLAPVAAGVLSVGSQADSTNRVELEVAMLGRIAGVAGVALFVVVVPSPGWPQDAVKKVPMRPIASIGGKDVYKAYCAHCHGDDLKGRGPAVDGLPVPATDLTTIALRNNGTFSQGAVEASINGWERCREHSGTSGRVSRRRRRQRQPASRRAPCRRSDRSSRSSTRRKSGIGRSGCRTW